MFTAIIIPIITYGAVAGEVEPLWLTWENLLKIEIVVCVCITCAMKTSPAVAMELIQTSHTSKYLSWECEN